MGKAGAGKRSEKRPLLQTGIGKALFGLLVLAVACAGRLLVLAEPAARIPFITAIWR